MKISLTQQQEEMFQLLGTTINGKYVYFPKIYIKTDSREYQEVDFEVLPEGIKKYINEKKGKNNG